MLDIFNMDQIVKEYLAYAVIVLLAIGFAFAVGYQSGQAGNTSVRTVIVRENNTNTNTPLDLVEFAPPLETISLLLPGVDQQRRGTVATLEVQRLNGSGRTFFNFDENRPSIANETQVSMKNAVKAARTFNQLAAGRFAVSDLLYVLRASTSEVGGESAGAAMAVATIALLEGKTLNSTVAITGTVNADGSIGPVGEILAKAQALKLRGITTFLVPPGESVQEIQSANNNEVCTDEVVAGGVYRNCRTDVDIQTRTVNISQEAGLTVIEVPNVAEAYAKMVVAS